MSQAARIEEQKGKVLECLRGIADADPGGVAQPVADLITASMQLRQLEAATCPYCQGDGMLATIRCPENCDDGRKR